MILAVVPARAGSKGLPGKNLSEVDGVSLVGRAVDAARSTPGIDAVVVSSDGDAILEEGARHGATPDRRPTPLASDAATVEDVVVDLLTRHTDATVVVVLQPTSPLRTSADIAACLDALDGRSTATTVTPLVHPLEWTFRIDGIGGLVPVFGWDGLRARQELDVAYQLNGAVYAARTEHLLAGGRLVDADTAPVVMPPERSIDIDTAFDLELARSLAARAQDNG